MEKIAANRQKHKDRAQPKEANLVGFEQRKIECTATSEVLQSDTSSVKRQGITISSIMKHCCSSVAGNVSEQNFSEDHSSQKNLKMKDEESLNSNISLNVNKIRTFREDEENKLNRLGNNYHTWFSSSQETTNEYLGGIEGLVNMAMETVQRFVRFLKTVDEFKELTVDVQTVCLKSNLCSCLVLLGLGTYDVSTKCFLVQGKAINSDLIKSVFHNGAAEELLDLSTYFKEYFHLDDQFKALLHCILLFSPEEENLKNRQLLSNYQDHYLILLKHYFESKYSYREGKKLYVCLLQKLKDIKSVGYKTAETIKQISPERIQPLMLEVFNMEKKTKPSQ